jgi:hypothetical protein
MSTNKPPGQIIIIIIIVIFLILDHIKSFHGIKWSSDLETTAFWLPLLNEGYLEGNLSWALNKTNNEKKQLLYTKNRYILKSLLYIVTTTTEALVSGNKFLYACVKEVCHR